MKAKRLLRFLLAKWKTLLILVVLVVVILVVKSVLGPRKSELEEVSSENGRIEVEEVISSFDVSREFSYPLKDNDGFEISQIKFIVDKAELRNEIIVKGKKARSVVGRTFLVINLKIINEYDRPIEVDSRDYFRLSVNKNDQEWLAPDIHNDPVEVQAISTKLTRIAFPVNETDRDFVLQVGEIDGEKEQMSLDLSYN